MKADHRTVKAEHRKELKTNELADMIGRAIEGAKHPNRNWLIAGGVVLAVALLIGVYMLFSGGSSKSGRLLVEVNGAVDLKQLEQIAEKNPGTVAARTSNFMIARLLYQEGIRDLPSSELRPGAITKLERARSIYEKLAAENEEPVLKQEALMWTARCEESLIGALSTDKPTEPAGSIDKAIVYYQKLANMKPETFETKSAAERAKVLEEKRTQVEAFYAKLGEQAGRLKK
jgi:hypothetical protein